MKTNKVFPPTRLLIAISAVRISHLLAPGGRVVPKIWNLTGLVLLIAGVKLNLTADNAFQKTHSTGRPFEESTESVTTAVFQFSSTPIYLGFCLILAGIAIVS